MTITHLRNFILATALLSGASAYAQSNVGIGTSSPSTTAILDITNPAGSPLGSDKGLLIPRMTYAQRIAISGPAQGLMVYQTNTSNPFLEGIYYYDSVNGWQFLSTSTTVDNLGNHIATKGITGQGNTGDNIAVVGLGIRSDGGLNLSQNTVGNNFAIGYQAGQAVPAIASFPNAGLNTYLGYSSGASPSATAAANNTFVGYQSGKANQASNNTFIGSASGQANTSGTSNVFIGFQAGTVNTTGTNNQFVGYQTGTANIGGNNNAFFGYRSGTSNTAGSDNSYFGHQSGLNARLNSSKNIYIGYQSGFTTVNNSQNQFIGYQSGFASSNSSVSNSNNQFTGFQSGFTNTLGIQNYFSGFQSGYLNVQAINNQFTGYQSGYNNNSDGAASPSGNTNQFDGIRSGYANVGGNSNQFSGYQSGGSNLSGNNNLCIGYQAGNSTTVSGTATGVANTIGSNNTFIGYQAGPMANNLNNATAIGNSARVNQDNSFVIGAPSSSPLTVNVGIGITTPAYKLDVAGDINCTGKFRVNTVDIMSDARFKQNVQPLTGALAQVLRARGVHYTFRQKDFPTRNFPAGSQIGVIAQELEQVFPELVSTAADGYKAVNYAQLTPVLIEAIKELAGQNAALRQQLTEQQGRDAGQTAEIRTMQKQLARLLGEESGSASAKQ